MDVRWRFSSFRQLVRCVRCFSSRPHSSIDRIIRVDHAGEFGADRIYAGQMAVLGRTPVGPVIKVRDRTEIVFVNVIFLNSQHMWEQEKVHLELFEKHVRERRVRPTVLMPIWNIAGYVLGRRGL